MLRAFDRKQISLDFCLYIQYSQYPETTLKWRRGALEKEIKRGYVYDSFYIMYFLFLHVTDKTCS